jgi:hypothetical protein
MNMVPYFPLDMVKYLPYNQALMLKGIPNMLYAQRSV